MQRFSLDRGRFAGHPRRGFPHPLGGSPSPSKSPPEGGDPTPQGAGACRPPVRPLASPSTPLGHPCGVPPASPAPPPAPVRQWKGVGKRSAQGRQPRRGVGKKSKWWRRSRPLGRQRWKCGEGRAAGGQGWGQPVGSPPGCPRGVPAPVHGPRSAGRSRSDLHISTAGGPTRPPLGACFAPQGSRLPFRKSSEYTCLSSGPPEARF